MSDKQQAEQPDYIQVPVHRTSAWVKLTLLVLVGACAGTAYLYVRDVPRLQDQARDQERDLRQALSTSTQAAADIKTNLDGIKTNLEGEVRSQRTKLDADLEQNRRLIQSISDNLTGQIGVAINKHIIGGSYRNYEDKWIVQQASYLLRMAKISLYLETSVTSAAKYLRQASDVLERKNIPELAPIRTSVLKQISTLQTSTVVDVKTPYLRLSALLSQLQLLPLAQNWVVEQMDSEDNPITDPNSPVLERILSLFRFRVKDDLEVRSPQMVEMARLQLGLIIEQAKSALVSRRVPIYKAALERGQKLIDVYFDVTHPQVEDFRANMTELLAMSDKLTLPEIDEPLTMLDAYRTQQEDGWSLEAAADDADGTAP